MGRTTLTPTRARATLSQLPSRSLKGEDLGLLFNEKVGSLRPVTVESTDGAAREYGVSVEELKKFETEVRGRVQEDRKVGKLKAFTGDLEALLTGESR